MKFEIYKTAEGWRWRLLSPLGKVIALSPEAHPTWNKADNEADALVTRIAAMALAMPPGEVIRIEKVKLPVPDELKAKNKKRWVPTT